MTSRLPGSEESGSRRKVRHGDLLRCHSETLSGAERRGAPSDHNFDSHELIMSQIDHIDEQAAAGSESTNTLMPIGSPAPTEEERRKFGEWLACGVP